MQDKNRTILVAEDDLLVRKTTVYYLKGKGYNVLEVSDGKEALRLFREKEPDILLTDLRMPELDGMRLVQTIVSENPIIPVIIFSGMGTMVDVIEALRIGAWDYITKPIADLEILNHSIMKALSHAALMRQEKTYKVSLEEKVQQRTTQLTKQNKSLNLK